MKKLILVLGVALAFSNAYAQKEGGFRVGWDFGYTVPSNGGGGLLAAIEPKYNIADDMNVGLRIGAAAMIRDVQGSGGSTTSAKVSVNGSYVATYDYYFNDAGKAFVPYMGGGVGYYSIANVEFDQGSDSNQLGFGVNGKMGALVRGGFEWGKFRMGMEYNLVPKSDLHNTSGATIGTVSNTYLGFHLGFYVGGGKWRN